MEGILDPANLNRAYKAVMRNKGCGGIDKMSCEQLLPWLLANKDGLVRSLMDGSYRPNPVQRVEIPKDNGKMRLLGIPTVVDRLVHQALAIAQKVERMAAGLVGKKDSKNPSSIFNYRVFNMLNLTLNKC